ncbi:hypothetical protein TSUD_126160 [Trifolium subterraneum]|uniref:Phytol kinase n=1 Tax=Trifolium subterraneum TaxID=3900 RepID=A0A2Z6MVF4_TRISU|nr:hypothetical protein TSUD_126160 [Trifolium subterraneum]
MLHHDPLISDFSLQQLYLLSLFSPSLDCGKKLQNEDFLIRKLVHISIGLVLMLCWPLFSTDRWGSYFAAFIIGVNIFRMLVIELGIWKDEATVTSKGTAVTITLATIIYWRNSPISIAAICNLCAGDVMADVVGRRFSGKKIPYNKSKSYAGSITMASSGFLASIGYMWYFSSFGFMEGSWKKVIGFLVVSVATAIVESLPISTDFDDNLTVPLTSILVGRLSLLI